jgi:hypothetical protein
MSTPTDNTLDTDIVDPSHIDSARKFFEADQGAAAKAEADKVAADKAAAEKAAADKAAADKASKKPNVLESVIKLPSKGTEEKPPATTEEDPIAKLQDPPETTKNYADWKTLKTLANDFKTKFTSADQERTELKKKLKEVESRAPVDAASSARLAELEAQNRQYSERLKVLDARSHPDFEKEFLAPKKQSLSTLERILKDEEIADVNLTDLLSLKGRALNQGVSEVLAKLTPFSQGAFSAEIRRVVTLDEQAQAALAKADDFLKTRQTQSSARSREVFDRVGAEFNGLYAPIEVAADATAEAKAAAQEYNGQLQQISRTAESLAFGQIDDATAVRMAHESAMYRFTMAHGLPRIGELLGAQITERDARIATLEAELKGIKAARPGFENDGGGDTPPTEPAEDHLAAARKYYPAR